MGEMSERVPRDRRPDSERKAELWELHWGATYNQNLKEQYVKPLFAKWEREGKIGAIVADIGGGAFPVSDYIPGSHKIITVDIAGYERESEDKRRIRYDIEKVSDESSFSTRKALVKLADFLDIDPRNEASSEQIDTMIFSDVLNYVDYETVLAKCAEYLKTDGRFIIINKPGRGFVLSFSDKGVKTNERLINILKGQHFEIEQIEPIGASAEESNSDDVFDSTMIAIVAKKLGREIAAE